MKKTVLLLVLLVLLPGALLWAQQPASRRHRGISSR